MRKILLVITLALVIFISGCDSYEKLKDDYDYICEVVFITLDKTEYIRVESYSYHYEGSIIELVLTNGDLVYMNLDDKILICEKYLDMEEY